MSSLPAHVHAPGHEDFAPDALEAAGTGGTEAEWNTHYYAARHGFSGADYDPAEWASTARRAGMKYLVFTTKHHDGFSLYDAKCSSLTSTVEDGALGRDVVRETFDAFRAEGLETGVYYSKPDWGHPSYWGKGREITDRWSNVSPATEPEHWRPFVEYTHRQVDELLPYPWEHCIPVTSAWCSVAPEERTTPIGDAIANLVTTIARGGNYLLGVGPDATGAMSSHIRRGLEAIGTWVSAHESAIYGTRAPQSDPGLDGATASGEWFATRSDDALNLFYLPEDIRQLDHDHAERLLPGGPLHVSSADLPAGELTATILDSGTTVPLTRRDEGVELQLPEVPLRWAACVRIESATR